MKFWKKLEKTVDRATTDRKKTVRLALEAGYEGNYEDALEILDEAIYLFDSVLDKPTTKAEFWRLKAMALNELKRNEEALKAIEKSKEYLNFSIKNELLYDEDEEYDTGALDIIHSGILHDLGKYEEALKPISIEIPKTQLGKNLVKGLKKIFKEVPDTPEVAIMKAHLLSHLDKNTEALELYNKSLKEDPNNLDAWFEKSEVLQELGRFDEAMKACEEGLKIDPDDGDLLGQKGSILIDLKNTQEALSYFEQSIQSDSTDDISWYNKACALSILNKKEEALDALTVATALDSENIIEMKDDKELDNIRDTERFKRLANQEI